MRNRKLLLAAALSLAACQPRSQTDTASELPAKYLACYALSPAAKSQCQQELAFEAEKLGFKQFIKAQYLSCDAVIEGPEFVEAQQAYLVKCQPKGQHLMRFCHEQQRWELVKATKNDK